MQGKTIVYGAHGGVGEWVCRNLPRGTAHMVSRNEDDLSPLCNELGHSFTAGDAMEEELFKRAVIDVDGPISGLVYAVGNIRLKSLKRVTPEEILEDFQLHALGAALAVQAAAPKMEEGASIVLYSSVAASTGFPNHTSVALAKGAIEGLTRALAAELSPKIRINAIAPSLSDTPMAAAILASDAMKDAMAKSHPLRRLGTDEDLGAMTLHLLSPQASWITGQVFPVDGGRSVVAGK